MKYYNKKTVSAPSVGTVISIALIAVIILFLKPLKEWITNLFGSNSGLRSITDNLGLTKSQSSQNIIKEQTSNTSPFSRDFYKKNAPPNTVILTKASAKKLLKDLHECWGLFSDNVVKAKGIFQGLRTQAQCSFLCDILYQEYGVEMLEYLKGVDIWPNDRLSDNDVDHIVQIVHSKPKYKP